MTWLTSSGPRWLPSRRCRRAASCCWRAWRRRARPTSTWRPSTPRCKRGEGAIVLVPEVSLIPQLADRLAWPGRRRPGGAALGPVGGGAPRRVVADPPGRGARGGRHPDARSSRRSPVRCCSSSTRRTTPASSRIARRATTRVGWRAGVPPLSGGRVVFGTATPDVVTLARVRGGLVERSVLHERRVGQAPRIELVDLRDELSEGNRSIFSRLLHAALRDLRPGTEQAILLMNRRGASTFILCRDCGESLRCPDCDLPFVYHSASEQLRCHHCGRTAPPPERCPHCGSSRIRYFGAGTQRVEAELRSTFPHLRVARLDSDALAARRGFEAIYDDLRDGRIDVLVGTPAGGQGPRPADRDAGRGRRRRRDPQPAGLPGAGAHLPAAGPGRRASGSGTDAGAGHHPDLRRRPLRGAGGGQAGR